MMILTACFDLFVEDDFWEDCNGELFRPSCSELMIIARFSHGRPGGEGRHAGPFFPDLRFRYDRQFMEG